MIRVLLKLYARVQTEFIILFFFASIIFVLVLDIVRHSLNNRVFFSYSPNLADEKDDVGHQCLAYKKDTLT